MAVQLNDVELRVLGVLIEKSLSQPGSYPMTVNSVLLGANQKQNRDPVVEFTVADVTRTLYTLQQKQIVKQAPPSPSARANRFEHNVVERFHWDRREQAVLAELMMRGRQTPGELRTRASRMTPFQDLPAVIVVLEALARYETPFVKELPREPGRSANRWRHLLGMESAAAGHSASPSPSGGMGASQTVGGMAACQAAMSSGSAHMPALRAGMPPERAGMPPGKTGMPPEVVPPVADLATRVARLEDRVAELERVIRGASETSPDALDATGASDVS